METKRKAELVFILDRSGSMSGLESDTIGGYNAMMDKQRESGGEITVSTVLFDDRYELLHDRIAIDKLKPMSEKEYFTRGSTALIDAIGKTIKRIENAQNHTAKKHKADTVIFVITTDGLENASREFRAEDVKKMVEKKREKNGWEFIFLGANIDAVGTAKSYGFAASRAANFVADSAGVACSMDAVSDTIHFVCRRSEPLSDAQARRLLNKVESDHKKRGKLNK